MKSANFIGLMTYIMAFGIVMALWNENIYVLFKFSSITLALYLIFIFRASLVTPFFQRDFHFLKKINYFFER